MIKEFTNLAWLQIDTVYTLYLYGFILLNVNLSNCENNCENK